MSSPKWRRGRRVEKRKAERATAGTTSMAIPAGVLALGQQVPSTRRHLPCLVDPACPIDHLRRKRKGPQRGRP